MAYRSRGGCQDSAHAPSGHLGAEFAHKPSSERRWSLSPGGGGGGFSSFSFFSLPNHGSGQPSVSPKSLKTPSPSTVHAPVAAPPTFASNYLSVPPPAVVQVPPTPVNSAPSGVNNNNSFFPYTLSYPPSSFNTSNFNSYSSINATPSTPSYSQVQHCGQSPGRQLHLPLSPAYNSNAQSSGPFTRPSHVLNSCASSAAGSRSNLVPCQQQPPPPGRTNPMPAIEMFKFKQAPQHVLDNNPIMQQYEIGRQVGSAGPELVWKIYEAVRRSDKKESSVFVFEKKLAEKLHKPRRKETITEILRQGVKELERFKHPKLLNVLHPVEESSDALAFATEPVMGSLANLIGCSEDKSQQNLQLPVKQGPDYTFMDIEIKYGILQVTEALCFLHYMGQVIHRNVSPQSVIVNKRGTWKLSGLEFLERANNVDVMVPITCHPWTSKIAKMAQSDLDYTAPEVQITSTCSPLSDMFSLGMLICAIFNKGRSLIEANHSSSTYLKHLEVLEENLSSILDKIPRPLQEPVQKLLSKGSKQRPSAQLFSLTKYFSDSVVHTLQYLDVVQMKDATQKAHFYHNLRDMIYLIPKKLWFQHVFPSLQQEIQSQEVLAAALQPIIVLIQESSSEEYLNIILPSIRCLFSMPKSIQSTVTLLENLHIFLEKTPDEDIKSEILPMLYSAFDSATPQVQCAALQAVASIADHLDEAAIRKMVLPRAKLVFTKNAGLKAGEVAVQSKVLACIEKIIDKLEKTTLLDEVLPMLADVKLQDPVILMTVVNIYKQLLSDKKYGLTVNLIATKVLPSLTPQMVNPALDLDNFTLLMGVIQEMFYQVDRNQRNKLKLDNLTLPVNDKSNLRQLHSAENVPTFQISGMRSERKKTSSSVEDVVRRDSNSSDSNFLRVQAAFNNRRHSDNALLIPNIQVNPSSPDGGSPTGFGGNFPIRRHSSVGPPEAKYLQQQRTSLTNSFLNAAPSTFKGGRRFSACVTTGLGGNPQQGLLQQLGSGVAQLFSGK